MKILCFIDSLDSGGAQRQLVELATGFKEKGHEVSLLTYHNIPFFNLFLEHHNISIETIEERNYLKRLIKVRHFIRQSDFHAVLSFLEAPNIISQMAGIPSRKWKLVVGERRINPLIKRSLKLIFYRWFHFFADFIVSNSSTNIKYVLRVNPLLSKSKCRVIYNIVDLNRWKPHPDFIFRKNLKIKLIVGASHLPRKNAPGLIEAISLLNDSELDKISIEWYGNKPNDINDYKSFESAVKKLNDLKLNNVISFHPATNKILKIVQDADAVGLFSFSEGMPNIICEGMACGKPVICSTVSDIVNLLSYDKNLLCDPADEHSIASSIRYLISLDQEKLREIGNRNRKIAMENFQKDKIISDYLKLLID